MRIRRVNTPHTDQDIHYSRYIIGFAETCEALFGVQDVLHEHDGNCCNFFAIVFLLNT